MNALLLIDLQNDFLPGGPLAVPGGDEVLPLANRLMRRFNLVAATQDWHPLDHGSFASNHLGKKPGDQILLAGREQILWPVHCVKNSSGAEFAPGLETARIDNVFRKGEDPSVDSYSGFFDNGRRRSTGLAEFLRNRGVRGVYIAGLATDYCVKYTALDAKGQGFDAYVIADACRGVELHPGDVQQALSELIQAGVQMLKASDVISSRSRRATS